MKSFSFGHIFRTQSVNSNFEHYFELRNLLYQEPVDFNKIFRGLKICLVIMLHWKYVGIVDPPLPSLHFWHFYLKIMLRVCVEMYEAIMSSNNFMR